MPAVPPYIIEPIWEQLVAVLPDRETDHPLGCHRPRVSDRLVFEKLVQVLVFGCAYEKIAEKGCSATTLGRRRDEWIGPGLVETLRRTALEAYDRVIGLEISELAVDCCITKAPCGGEKAGVGVHRRAGMPDSVGVAVTVRGSSGALSDELAKGGDVTTRRQVQDGPKLGSSRTSSKAVRVAREAARRNKSALRKLADR